MRDGAGSSGISSKSARTPSNSVRSVHRWTRPRCSCALSNRRPAFCMASRFTASLWRLGVAGFPNRTTSWCRTVRHYPSDRNEGTYGLAAGCQTPGSRKMANAIETSDNIKSRGVQGPHGPWRVEGGAPPCLPALSAGTKKGGRLPSPPFSRAVGKLRLCRPWWRRSWRGLCPSRRSGCRTRCG